MDTPGFAGGVTVYGDYAYIADGVSGLQLIDISDPQNAAFAGYVDTYYANDITINNDSAYVADGDSGIKVINVANPAAPVIVASIDTSGSSRGVFISGNHLYVADGSSGLQMVDVTNPNSPTSLGAIDISPSITDESYQVAVSGNYAYVHGRTIGCAFQEPPWLGGGCGFWAWFPELFIFDVSSPINPVFIGSHHTGEADGIANGIAVNGDYVYVAGGGDGLFILEHYQDAPQFSYILDQSPATIPDSIPEDSQEAIAYSNLPDGEYYFHIAFVDNGISGPASHRRVRIGASCGQTPDIRINSPVPFWESYAAYASGELLVDFSIGNSGPVSAYSVIINGVSFSGGVTLCDTCSSTIAIGDLGSGQSQSFRTRFEVPDNIDHFSTRFSGNALDICGNSYDYGT